MPTDDTRGRSSLARRSRLRSSVASGFLLTPILLGIPSPSSAHIRNVRGHLVDLVRESDVVIVGIVTSPASLSPGGKELGLDVVATLYGTLDRKELTVRTKARLMAGERQVIFLKREGTGFLCVQPSGSRFPAAPADDSDYKRAVDGIAAALALPENEQVRALRSALIPALQSRSLPLRYHAALELSALNHDGHELTPEQRTAIEAARGAADFDPALQPVVDALLRENASR